VNSRARLLAALAVVAAGASASACTAAGAYRAPDGLSIVAPADRSDVGLPVRVAWSGVSRAKGYVVVVDRVPMPVGKTVTWFGAQPVGVIATVDTELLLGRSVTAKNSRSARHIVTVVAVDHRGRRMNEDSAQVTFRTGAMESEA